MSIVQRGDRLIINGVEYTPPSYRSIGLMADALDAPPRILLDGIEWTPTTDIPTPCTSPYTVNVTTIDAAIGRYTIMGACEVDISHGASFTISGDIQVTNGLPSEYAHVACLDLTRLGVVSGTISVTIPSGFEYLAILGSSVVRMRDVDVETLSVTVEGARSVEMMKSTLDIVHLDSCAVEVEHLTCRQLDGVSMASARMLDLRVDRTLKLDTMAGDIKVGGQVGSTVALTSMSGQVSFYGSAAASRLNTINGHLAYGGEAHSATLSSMNGDIHIGHGRKGTIDARTTNGDIIVHGESTDLVLAHTISGSLMGESACEIQFSTVNGANWYRRTMT